MGDSGFGSRDERAESESWQGRGAKLARGALGGKLTTLGRVVKGTQRQTAGVAEKVKGQEGRKRKKM